MCSLEYCVFEEKRRRVGLGNVAYVVALSINVIAGVLIYLLIFQMTKSILRRGRIRLASFIILIAPFSLDPMTVGNVPNLLWVLFFAPFYGVVILLLTFTNYMLIYYGAA